MSIIADIKATLRNITNISGDIDTDAAERSIRNNIYFRGPTVWILAFSIVVASVGLNVNSTAVIIGAMLISPLMGPIIGIGLSLGITDKNLLKDALVNLGVMVVISLIASVLYFLITPLKLANPTELLSRVNPTIYDVIIALFGGFAGILELSRKDKGTVLSGVAIATALMPPLCTAGFGLATGNLGYFLGAIFLFLLNCIFIILATYLAVKYLGYKQVAFSSESMARKTNRLMSAIIIIVMIPSIWTAVQMIRSNKFTQKVTQFVESNKMLSNGYIYDYQINPKKGGTVTLYITGGEMTASDKNDILESAEKLGISGNQIQFREHSLGTPKDESSEKLLQGIYERTDNEINRREQQIRSLEEELSKYRKEEVPYIQLTKEIVAQYPDIKSACISKGAEVSSDSLKVVNSTIVIIKSAHRMADDKKEKLHKWLQIRLEDENVEVMSVIE